MPNTVRALIDALLPTGAAWNIKQDSDLDKMFLGSSDNWQNIIDDLSGLCCIRDPNLTTILSDLEKEYGIVSDPSLTYAIRRMQLAAIVFQGTTNGSKDALQNALQAAGFDVQVHENSPAIDPDTFLNNIFFMVAGGDNAYAGFYPTTPGEYTSIAGRTGGSLLVNGASYTQRPAYTSVADNSDFMFAGNGDAVAGRYDTLERAEILYPIPDDPDSWPFFFFVGGDATRNVSGELTDIEVIDIPVTQKTVFERIILKYKPIHTWAGLMVNYV